MAGRTGLQYIVLFAFLDRLGLSGSEWDETLEDIRTMEVAALNAMNQPA